MPAPSAIDLDQAQLDSLTHALARAAAQWFVDHPKSDAPRWISARALAEQLGYEVRVVQNLLAEGRVPGAVRGPHGRNWRIPSDAAANMLGAPEETA